MYSVFTEQRAETRGEVTFPEFIYTRAGLQREKAEIIEYYRKNPKYLDSRHFLVRLIQSITVPFNGNRRLFFDQVSDLTPRLARSFEMTSPVSEGKLFEDPGVFYGRNSREIILALDEEFDVDEDWEELRPIEVIRHDHTSLAMRIPNGELSNNERRTAVIGINLPKLALQYQLWAKHQNEMNPNEAKAVSQFLMTYVLPNMVHSHLDLAVLNRLVYYPAPPSAFRDRAHPFYVTDFTDRVDKVMGKQKELFNKRKREFPHWLANIPLIDAEDAKQALDLPEVPPTRQIEWALIMARLPYIHWLLELNERTDNHHNREYLKQIRRDLRDVRSDKTLKKVLPRKMYDEVEALLEGRIDELVR